VDEQILAQGPLAYPSRTDQEHRGCCACYRGVVYIGHVQDEDGDEVEVIEAIPCRRCNDV
jgi:hypothetical protein